MANADFHQPNDLYGACKSLNEQLGLHYRRERGLDCTGVRFSVVYGYGKALTLARGTGADFLQALIDKPALGQASTVPYGDEILDFLYVTDAARAVVAATQTPHNPSIGLNICGSRHSIRDVAEHVQRLLPNIPIEVQSGTWGGGMHYEMATTESEIGYSPQVALADGLRRNINDLRRLHGLETI